MKLLDAYAEISEIAKTVLDSSVQLDEDARSIVAEQKPRLNGVSNGLLRIDAKTNLRDKSDASLAVAAQNLRESLTGAEQLARSQGKSVQEVSGGIRGALSSAQGIVSRLAALRGAAAKMSVIAETFTGVADQANILSLNLSIETAKSGIKGSGLGTLAEQVKILSKRTVVSVIDIESIRDSILETLDAGAYRLVPFGVGVRLKNSRRNRRRPFRAYPHALENFSRDKRHFRLAARPRRLGFHRSGGDGKPRAGRRRAVRIYGVFQKRGFFRQQGAGASRRRKREMSGYSAMSVSA